ncbi:MAG: hypothetical protein ACI4FX_07655 [Agathobacter sp.]
MKLIDFQNKFHIRRINFADVSPAPDDASETCASDKLICPYCGAEIEYDSEDVDGILDGTPWQCIECDKYFYAEGEVGIDTICTPMEDKVLEKQRYIESIYDHMDRCAQGGVEFDDPHGVLEYEIYKDYAEPLFANAGKEEKP